MVSLVAHGGGQEGYDGEETSYEEHLISVGDFLFFGHFRLLLILICVWLCSPGYDPCDYFPLFTQNVIKVPQS